MMKETRHSAYVIWRGGERQPACDARLRPLSRPVSCYCHGPPIVSRAGVGGLIAQKRLSARGVNCMSSHPAPHPVLTHNCPVAVRRTRSTPSASISRLSPIHLSPSPYLCPPRSYLCS